MRASSTTKPNPVAPSPAPESPVRGLLYPENNLIMILTSIFTLPLIAAGSRRPPGKIMRPTGTIHYELQGKWKKIAPDQILPRIPGHHTPPPHQPPHPLFRYSRGGGFLFSMVLLACPRRVAGDIHMCITIRFTYSLHDGHQNSAKRPSHMFPL